MNDGTPEVSAGHLLGLEGFTTGHWMLLSIGIEGGLGQYCSHREQAHPSVRHVLCLPTDTPVALEAARCTVANRGTHKGIIISY